MIARRSTPRPKALWKQVREEINGPEPENPRKLLVRRSKAKPQTAGIGYWKKKRVSQVSKTRERINRLYLFIRALWKPEWHGCCVHQGERGSEVHHFFGRAGTLLLDWRFWKVVCRDGHIWIGDHIAEAREMGVLCDEGKFNCPPDDERTRELKEIMNLITRNYSDERFKEAKRKLKELFESDEIRFESYIGDPNAKFLLTKS
jgi:hypothetical protein